MKIIFILSRIEKNGVTSHTLDLARGLIAEGHELTMITGGIQVGPESTNFAFLNDIQQEFKDAGVKLLNFKIPTNNIFSKLYGSVFSMLQVLYWLATIKTDIIHCQSPNTTFLPWLLRKKFITTVHSDLLLPNMKYKNPTKLIAVSTESKQYGIDILGSVAETTPIVYHGISERFADKVPDTLIASLKEKYKLPTDKILIGCVGRITPVKGLDILMRVVEEQLTPELRDKIHLVFLGDYAVNTDKPWFDDVLKTTSILDKITLVPFQDPKPFYQLFDIFVLPSISETFGLVAVEAMMSKCCTVRSNAFGGYDQITNGENGYIYDIGDDIALGKILAKLIDNKALREQIAAKGKEQALALFTIKAMTKGTVKVYESLTPTKKYA